MKQVRVSGQTWNYRDRLRDMGGRWDGAAKNWSFDFINPKQLAELKNMPGCLVTEKKPEPTDWTPKPRDVDPLESAVSLIERVSAMLSEDTAQERHGKTTFYGDDRQYFNYFKDRNPISYVGFSTLGKFVNWIEAIPKHVEEDARRNAGWQTDPYKTKWTGSRDMQHAIDLARNGWQEGVENAAKITEWLTAGHALQRRRSYSVAGGNVSVGRMLAGNPAHMIRRPKLPGTRVITLFVQNNGLADIMSETMIARSAICCAIVDLIEQNGFSCELISVTTDYATRGTPGEHLVVKLKSAGEKLNLADVAFALGHPAFFRRFGFAAIGQAEELRDQWLGMGYSTEAFNSTHQPGRNEFYIPHLKQNVKGETMEERARNLLPLLIPKGLPLEMGLE